ncbi:Riboflavin kinase [Tolypocladium ophioglossoides CBS 100239]|uniref:Riboflavin kinase n=1 Tax=Tolypocladium ophioglossoides (strain CBS 100239) TaxID=1163406 RepID=A0A0L0MXB6_TOLOC|nr:Riboflavin kinase [Tolypocladium ophioglossoides CBS 100239]
MQDARRRPLGSNLVPPLPLRPSRSATQLRPNTQEQPKPPRFNAAANQQAWPVDFVVDELPLPDAPFAPGSTQGELRRVQSSSALSAGASTGSRPSKWTTALGEAQYVAGGLVSRPAESTRHYSIIRHSHALVWYRGPSTAVSITVLSDAPLPATRTLWLQEKGYSGGVGMTVKALMGSTGGWLDVTPARRAQPEHLPEVDERGIQRDLKRFAKKASGRLKGHVPRETHVVRIPATATDGYFRLVLCAGADGKKVLCGSPVFRVASTSTDAAVVRGASLSTMPLEVGVKVASTIGQQVAKKYTGIAGAVVQNRAAKVVKNAAVKRAGQAVHQGYRNAGLADAVGESWRKNKPGRYDPLVDGRLLPPAVTTIGSDAGPKPPFPLKFEGRVARASGASTAELGFPTANLRDVPETIKMRLGGVFAAWAMILPAKGLEDMSHDWHEAVVTIAPPRAAPLRVAMHNGVAVHIAHDLDGAFFDARLKVLLMGYLHPAAASDDPEELAGEHAHDVVTTLASLGRDNWTPHEAVAHIKTLERERSFSDRLDGATGRVRQHVDRIPLHWAGVRSEAGAMRDRVYGNGGLWISR